MDLKKEIEKHCQYALGTILIGDMDVHERTWLRHSLGTSIEGMALRDMT